MSTVIEKKKLLTWIPKQDFSDSKTYDYNTILSQTRLLSTLQQKNTLKSLM